MNCEIPDVQASFRKGRGTGQEEKGTTEDEMAGWHHYSMDMSLSELLKLVMDGEAGVLRFMGS